MDHKSGNQALVNVHLHCLSVRLVISETNKTEIRVTRKFPNQILENLLV